MRHVTEEDLILHHYGESEEVERIDRHLEGCSDCRAERERLVATLAAADRLPVPERPESYPDRVWNRLSRERLHGRATGWKLWLGWPRLSLAASAAVLLVVAFAAGHWLGNRSDPSGPPPQAVRERILLVAVGDHLERSQRLLIELVNAEEGGSVDWSHSRGWARELADDNGLYRRTARHAGDEPLAELLEELETVLLEVANGSAEAGTGELAELRSRIESRGLLIRVRLLGDDARQRGRRPPRVPDNEV